MKILVCAVLVVLAVSSSIVCAGPNPVKLLQDTVRPLQRQVTNAKTQKTTLDTFCTAFAISVQHRGWMTAAHCVLDANGAERDEPLFIDGHKAHTVRIDRENDLAVLQTPAWNQTRQLELAVVPPEIGDLVALFGYGWGQKNPFYFEGKVAQVEGEFEGWKGSFVGLVAIGGESGSPLVNTAGEVVGVAHISIGDNFDGAGSMLGMTAFSTLKAFDQGWVFGH